MIIRDASPTDAAACAAIYATYVRDTAISFELDPPSAEAMADRIAKSQRAHSWLVAEDRSEILGYAYAGLYKERPAYRWACEVSVYVDRDRQRGGLGRELYSTLFDRLTARGFLTLVAGITVPNPASVGFHEAFGFEHIGTWNNIGWKLDRWHDVAWYQRSVGDYTRPPTEPT